MALAISKLHVWSVAANQIICLSQATETLIVLRLVAAWNAALEMAWSLTQLGNRTVFLMERLSSSIYLFCSDAFVSQTCFDTAVQADRSSRGCAHRQRPVGPMDCAANGQVLPGSSLRSCMPDRAQDIFIAQSSHKHEDLKHISLHTGSHVLRQPGPQQQFCILNIPYHK